MGQLNQRDEPGALDSTKAQTQALVRMMIAALFCCAVGAVEMYLFGHPLLAAIFVATMAAMVGCAALLKRGVVSAPIAAVVPMLILCFVYTPVSWYTFDGPMGNTPYLSIIFVTMILLTDYRRDAWALLGLYFASLAGMTAHWLLRRLETPPTDSMIATLLAWALALCLITVILGNVKKQTVAYNRMIVDRSVRDALTGLYNRSALERILESFEARFAAQQADYIAMMFDVDRFKQANDRFGHAEGDAMLKTVAARIQAGTRETDYAVRYGGDEFLLLLPVLAKDDVRSVLARVGQMVGSIPGFDDPVTVSYGSAYRSECAGPNELIALSDQRMYAEKQRRRMQSGADTPADGPGNRSPEETAARKEANES